MVIFNQSDFGYNGTFGNADHSRNINTKNEISRYHATIIKYKDGIFPGDGATYPAPENILPQKD